MTKRSYIVLIEKDEDGVFIGNVSSLIRKTFKYEIQF